ncbi:putative type II secretion system protein HxcR [bioreactor metagenome]|uniref:Putative type II secretion system protein HxcR n=1 Tax=bioreactor metagenome TaxID=1076179 RepID=A0A645AHX9_9ZZZZ
MSNPLDIDAVEDISFITNKKIHTYYDKKTNIYSAMENHYSKQITNEALEDLRNSSYIKKSELKNISNFVQEAPIVKLTDSIITQAINKNASDIHLDPFHSGTLVRFRLDGILKEHIIIPKDIYPAVATRIKIKSSMDISKKMTPQDGKINYRYENRYLDLRTSSIPTLYGEKITIRILNKSNENITIDNIIYNDMQKQELRNALNNQGGIILVTGPTGSGKTTTLCALLNDINSKQKNIITIEDPIEYNIQGINQVNVNNKSGLTFSIGLRNILRQDPDIIMIGEIRDEETAEIAIKAAITGHLVLSTLHTNNTFSSISRLLDMKIPSYLVADSLVLVVSQRLVRKICPLCKQAYDPIDSELKDIELYTLNKLYRGKGCKDCNKTGYKGRIAILEIMKVNEDFREMIKNKKSSMELKNYSLKNGMSTFRDRAEELVKSGITTIEEIKRVFYEFL